MHGSLMVYLFVGPFAFGGLANIIVPLQIGAPDMAFPRLNALSYWLYLSGSLTMLLGFFVAGGPGGLRLDALRAALERDLQPRGGSRPLHRGAPAHRVLRHLHRRQHLRDGLLPARPRHDDVPDADLHLEHAGGRHPDPARVPGAHRGAHHALLRPALRDAHLHGPRRWRPGPVAAHLLVLGPPRGVHPRAPVLRDRDRRHRHVLAQARLRLPDDGLRDHHDRRPVPRGLGPPHVHDGRRCCSRSSRS